MTTAYDLVRSHYLASDAGDVAGMTKDFADDIEWVEAAGSTFAGRYVGLPAIAEGVFGPLQAAIEGFHCHWDELHSAGSSEDGDVVVMIGRYTGTFRSSGKPFEARTVHKWTAAGDRLVAFEQIVDSHLMWLAEQG